MPCARRWPSSCGRSSARAISWHWWPMTVCVVLWAERHAQEELSVGIFLSHYPAEGLSDAGAVAWSADRGGRADRRVPQSRLPFRAVLWRGSDRSIPLLG